MISDLDDLVGYAADRFSQPIIIVGHSWGSVLGSLYAARHPERIAGYVGIGQGVDFQASESMASQAAQKLAREAGKEDDAAKIETLYQTWVKTPVGTDDFDFRAFMEFRSLTTRYLDPNATAGLLSALVSPDLGWNDVRWQLMQLTNPSEWIRVQQPLLKALPALSPPESFSVPVAFIHGTNDYVTSLELAVAYQERVSAPVSTLFLVEGLGHMLMVDDPVAFAKALREAVEFLGVR